MRVLAWVVISMMFLGCDSDPVEVDAGTGDAGSVVDAGTGSDAGGAADAGEGADAGLDAGVEDAGGDAELRVGTLSLTQMPTAPTGPLHVFHGAFYSEMVATPALEQGLAQPCEPDAVSGSCGFYRCTELGARASAGTITADVEGVEVLNVTRGDTGDYTAGGGGTLAAPGDAVTFDVSGDEVPAFSATVTAPGVLDIEIPMSVARDAPLTITWSTSAATDRVTLSFSVADGAIACTVDASEETVTVDAELLGMLPAGQGSIAVSASNVELVTIGEYRVLVTVAEAAGGAVTLE